MLIRKKPLDVPRKKAVAKLEVGQPADAKAAGSGAVAAESETFGSDPKAALSKSLGKVEGAQPETPTSTSAITAAQGLSFQRGMGKKLKRTLLAGLAGLMLFAGASGAMAQSAAPGDVFNRAQVERVSMVDIRAMNTSAQAQATATETGATGTQIVDADSAKAIAQASFDAGMQEGQKQRQLAAKIGMAPGELLMASKIPIVRNVGATLSSIGRLASSPFTLVAGAVTADGERAKDGADDLARGLLGIVGLEHVVMGGDYTKPGEGAVTGALSLPGKYAATITDAKSDWGKYSTEERNRDYDHGMKKWHTLSNAKLTAGASLGELPWVWIGGLAHELDPGGASAEIGAQGMRGWLWDSPLDVVANTMGMLGGLLLPDSAHQEYARIVGNIIPGPYDPFEAPASPEGANKSSTSSSEAGADRVAEHAGDKAPDGKTD